MSFQICALPRNRFEHLFTLSNEDLLTHRALRERVTRKPGTPCRVSLQDAEPGEDVILLHYTHQAADSPFHASHAIYVREHAEEARLAPDEIPAFLRTRLLSIRAFDNQGMMLDADVIPGTGLEPTIESLFERTPAEYLHIHSAKQGCYLARADRA
jgi:Protein of unknown function (DUF1203)